MVKLALHSIAYEAKTLNLAKEGYTAFYVDGTDGLDIHDGGSWGQAFKTIQHAVDEAEPWCKIYVGSRANSPVNATAAAAQKNIIVVDASDFAVGDKVVVRRESYYTEFHVIASISGSTLTMVSNLANTFYNIACSVITYYDEIVETFVDGISIIGESKTTTIISSTATRSVSIESDNVVVRNVCTMPGGVGDWAIEIEGRNAFIEDCTIDGDGSATTRGICIEGDGYHVVKNVRMMVPDAVKTGIYLISNYNVVSDCTIDEQTTGFYLIDANKNTIFNNEIKNCTTGLECAAAADNNSIFHNNFDTNTTQTKTATATNKWFENYYSNHTTDTNHDGITDTAYTEGGATDYQPVSRRNGWEQSSLPTVLSSSDLFVKTTKTITLGTGAVPVTETLFTVTGEVELYVVGYIDAAVTSAGALTLEVGIAGTTAGLIAQTAVGALLIDLMWMDATPATLVSKPSEKIIADGADIIHTIATADATAGAITYNCWWRAISSDGNVVAA